jgi:hypothetical protein
VKAGAETVDLNLRAVEQEAAQARLLDVNPVSHVIEVNVPHTVTAPADKVMVVVWVHLYDSNY